MKKVFLILLCASISSVYVSAQNSSSESKESINSVVTDGSEIILSEKTSWKDNWFIGGGIGASVYEGSADRRGPLSNRFGLNVDLSVGKWITPGIGLRLQYTGGQARGHIAESYANSTAYGNPFMGKAGYNVYKQKWDYNYFHGDLMFNLSNMIGGYKESRVYSVSPYLGAGVIHSFQTEKNTEIAGHFGIYNSFRVSPSVDLNIDVKGIMVGKRFDTEDGGIDDIAMNGIITASVGFVYKFNPRGFKRHTPSKTNDAELHRIRERLAQANKDKEELQNQLTTEKSKAPQVVERVTKELVLSGCVVDFKIGESKLSKIARVNLGYIAEAINTMSPNKVFTIIGYADNHSGSAKRNQTLSKERAQAVYNALVNEFGVDKSKLKIDYHGGVDNMFYDDPALSRVVIIE